MAVAMIGEYDSLEQAADTFAQETYNACKAQGLDKTCPF
jgi:hypothetical protein